MQVSRVVFTIFISTYFFATGGCSGGDSTGLSDWLAEWLNRPSAPGPLPALEAGFESYATPMNQPLIIPAENGVLSNDRFVTRFEPYVGLTEQGGFVDMQTDGGFAYYPPAHFAGADHFEYLIGNATASTVGRVRVKVLEPGDVPVP